MNRIIVHTVVGVLWLATPWAAIAGETGMSYDDTVNPGAPSPGDVSPGGTGVTGGGQTGQPIRRKTTGLDSVLPAQGSGVNPAELTRPSLQPPAPASTAPIKPVAPRPAATRRNCGTVWTGWIDNPDADVNPCQKGCERGEQQIVDAHIKGGVKQYNVRYQCYMAEAAPKPATGSSLASQSGTAPATGTTEPRPVSGTPQGVSIADGQTASSTSAVDAAPGVKQMKLPPAAGRPLSIEKIEGPGTTITAITDVTITTLTVKWKPVPGASGYTLHAVANGLNNSVTGPEVKQPANLPNELAAPLAGLATGVGNTVWVSVRYPDGKTGLSDQKTVTMLPAENPKDFKAVSIGPGAVRLEWQPSPGAINYLVQGSNLPRMQTTNTAVAVSNLTPGTHEWTLIAVYPPGVYNDLNPSRLLATVAPDVTGRARYRVTINGFRVDRETMDDPLQRDGKGDEIYVAVYVAEYNSKNGQRLRSDVVRTPVFGDKSGFGADRNLAGSAGSSGGLKRSDSYPGTNPAVRTRAPSRLDMPFIVWEGELIAGENHLVVIPSIWEWDGSAGGLDVWSNSLRSSAPEARYQLQLALQQAVAEKRFSGWPGAHLSPPSFWGRSDAIPPMVGDRLIGLVAPTAGGVHYKYFDRALAINREFAEAELARTAQTSLPPGVSSLRFMDDPSLNDQFGGDYMLYLQVERLP